MIPCNQMYGGSCTDCIVHFESINIAMSHNSEHGCAVLTCPISPSPQLLHTKEEIPEILASIHELPAHKRQIHTSLNLDRAVYILFPSLASLAVLLREPAPQLGRVDVFIPVVRAAGHDADGPGRFGDDFGGEVGEGVARDGAADEPAAGLEMVERLAEEGRGSVDVFDYFEEGDKVEGLA